jgi:hypothetical protein
MPSCVRSFHDGYLRRPPVVKDLATHRGGKHPGLSPAMTGAITFEASLLVGGGRNLAAAKSSKGDAKVHGRRAGKHGNELDENQGTNISRSQPSHLALMAISNNDGHKGHRR